MNQTNLLLCPPDPDAYFCRQLVVLLHYWPRLVLLHVLAHSRHFERQGPATTAIAIGELATTPGIAPSIRLVLRFGTLHHRHIGRSLQVQEQNCL
jgi:hypothetical protein